MSYTKLTDFAAKDALLSGNPSKLLRGTEIGAEFDAIESAMAVAEAVNITAPIIAASTSKTTPVDADVLPILDSAAANILKKVTWTNIKATLKTYFDTLYATAGTYVTAGAATGSGLTQATGKLLGRTTASTGAIEEITPGSTLTFAAGSLDVARPFTLGAVTNTTSGTAIDFTGLPSWAKRVTMSFNGVSTNGSSNLLMRLGAGSVETTGYSATACTNAGAGGSATDTVSNGFSLTHITGGSAASTLSGTVSFTLMNASTNLWACHGVLNSASGGAIYTLAGVKALAGALDRIRLTASNGTDTFDSGSVNITWE